MATLDIVGPFTSRATTNRVLEIPEILELVFSFLDREDNFQNLVVCKNWSELALNNLWRHVDDPIRLFSILSPMGPAPSALAFGPDRIKTAWVRCLLLASPSCNWPC